MNQSEGHRTGHGGREVGSIDRPMGHRVPSVVAWISQSGMGLDSAAQPEDRVSPNPNDKQNHFFTLVFFRLLSNSLLLF